MKFGNRWQVEPTPSDYAYCIHKRRSFPNVKIGSYKLSELLMYMEEYCLKIVIAAKCILAVLPLVIFQLLTIVVFSYSLL
jgi:hypothetical protein